MVEGKKKGSNAPITGVLYVRAEPGEEASEVSQIAPDPSVVVSGKLRMDMDQPSWQSSQEGEVLPKGSLGESPTQWAKTDVGISLAIWIYGYVLELANGFQKHPTRVLLDSGLTRNFICTKFMVVIGLKV